MTHAEEPATALNTPPSPEPDMPAAAPEMPTAEETLPPAEETAEPQPTAVVEPAPAEPAAESPDLPPAETKQPVAETTPPAAEAPAAPEPPAAPQEQPEPSADAARQSYWMSVLTGDPATIPDAVRRRAGADDDTEDADERNYRLLSAVNRSWAAEHLGLSREKVRADWDAIRAHMADEMGVASDEHEVFAGLSERIQRKKAEEQATKIYMKFYETGLRNRTNYDFKDLSVAEKEVAKKALRDGYRENEYQKPLVDELMKALNYFEKEELPLYSFSERLLDMPQLMWCANTLNEMDADERSRVYCMLSERLSHTPAAKNRVSVPAGMTLSMMRGVADLRLNTVAASMGLQNAAMKWLGEKTGDAQMERSAEQNDGMLQRLAELRRIAQGEAFPIKPKEDSGMLGQLMLDAAEATPAAVISVMGGGAGLAAMTVPGIGAAITEARLRAPEGDMVSQTAAGVVGSALQAGICAGLSKVGGNILSRSISDFARASGTGVRGYSVAALKVPVNLSAETARMALAAKAGEAANLGTQELFAQLDGRASNIDWQSYGHSLTDVDANMREAARTLPFVLMASGKLSLHHFKSPRAVLGDGSCLKEWGIGEDTIRRIMGEPNTVRQGDMLREALSGSRRWSAPGFFPEIMRSVKLLNTDDYQGFNDEKAVRDFLGLPQYQPEELKDEGHTAAGTKTGQAMSLLQYRRLEREELMEKWARFVAQDEAAEQPQQKNELTPRLMTPPVVVRRAEMVQQSLRNIRRLSYKQLLKAFTVDDLLNMKTPEADAEAHRIKLLKTAAREALASVHDAADASLFDERPKPAPKAVAPRPEEEEDPLLMSPMRNRMEDLRRRYLHPEVVDAAEKYEPPPVVVEDKDGGLKREMKNLMRLLSYTDEFQSVLSRGYTLRHAYAHLLHRELQFEDKTWLPDALRKTPSEAVDISIETRQAFQRYCDLTGAELESMRGEDRQLWWRVRRPNGKMTPWHPTREQAVNDVVANVRLNFLPLEGDDPESTPLPAASLAETQEFPNADFTRLNGFDQLCRLATNDLMHSWMQDATRQAPSLQLKYPAEDEDFTVRDRNAESVQPNMEMEGNFKVPQHLTWDSRTAQTPYSLVMGHLNAQWQRRINMGYVSAQEAADFLVRRRAVSAEEMDNIMALGEPYIFYPPPVERKPDAAARSGYGRAGRHPREVTDTSERNYLLAQALTRYSMEVMLEHLDEIPMPASAREWFGTAAFSSLAQPLGKRMKRIFHNTGGAAFLGWVNDAAAAEVVSLADRARDRRRKESKAEALENDPFFPHIRDCFFMPESVRLEQGWSYVLGGSRTLQAYPENMERLTVNPDEGWKKLNKRDRAQLVRELGGDIVQVRKRLRELPEMLRLYPQLREYGRDAQDNGLWHLRLEEPDSTASTETWTGEQHLAPAFRPRPYSQGVALERVEKLPSEWDADPRLMNALDTLQVLRRFAANAPMANEDGIWWRGKRYGGAEGASPSNSFYSGNWKPRPVLEHLLALYDTIYRENGEFGNVNVAGTAVQGLPLQTAANWLKNVTVYRCDVPDTPGLGLEAHRRRTNIMRLMPGEANVPLENMRRPYVVRSAMAAPLNARSIWMADTDALEDIYQPLNGFKAELQPLHGGDRLEIAGRRHLNEGFDMLMQRTRSEQALAGGAFAPVTNKELLLQMAEDSQFSFSLRSRKPTELTPAEAQLAALFHALLRYEYGGEAAAAQEVVRLSNAIQNDPDAKREVRDTLLRSRLGFTERSKIEWNGRTIYPTDATGTRVNAEKRQKRYGVKTKKGYEYADAAESDRNRY